MFREVFQWDAVYTPDNVRQIVSSGVERLALRAQTPSHFACAESYDLQWNYLSPVIAQFRKTSNTSQDMIFNRYRSKWIINRTKTTKSPIIAHTKSSLGEPVHLHLVRHRSDAKWPIPNYRSLVENHRSFESIYYMPVYVRLSSTIDYNVIAMLKFQFIFADLNVFTKKLAEWTRSSKPSFVRKIKKITILFHQFLESRGGNMTVLMF